MLTNVVLPHVYNGLTAACGSCEWKLKGQFEAESNMLY